METTANEYQILKGEPTGKDILAIAAMVEHGYISGKNIPPGIEWRKTEPNYELTERS